MIRISSKAQSWSIDIALGVIIFIGAFFVFYALLNANPNAKAGALNQESSSIIKQIASAESPLRVVDNNEVNISRVNELKNLSYDELKRRFRAESDFCLFFEDENGYLVLINNSYKGIGSPDINLSGTPCSQK